MPRPDWADSQCGSSIGRDRNLSEADPSAAVDELVQKRRLAQKDDSNRPLGLRDDVGIGFFHSFDGMNAGDHHIR